LVLSFKVDGGREGFDHFENHGCFSKTEFAAATLQLI